MMQLEHLRPLIERYNNAMTRALLRQDYAIFASFYTEDAVMISYFNRQFGRPMVGADQISYLRAMMPAVLEWEITVDDLLGSKDTPCQIGHSVMRNCVGGEEYLIHEDVFLIWRLQSNGDYKILSDTSVIVSRKQVC